MISSIADIEPKTKANSPNARHTVFFSKIQLNRPNPCSQHTTISMTTGAIRPRQENPNAPTNLSSGPIDGKTTATITAQITTDALQNIETSFKTEKKTQILKMLYKPQNIVCHSFRLAKMTFHRVPQYFDAYIALQTECE